VLGTILGALAGFLLNLVFMHVLRFLSVALGRKIPAPSLTLVSMLICAIVFAWLAAREANR
jgi:hypothetical protein